MEITSDTMEAAPFLQRELSHIGIVVNPRKTAALPPKGHVPTLEECTLIEGIDVRIAERGGINVVCVPIGTKACTMANAMEIVENVGAEQLAQMLPPMPDKQSANLIATGFIVQRTTYCVRVSHGYIFGRWYLGLALVVVKLASWCL